MTNKKFTHTGWIRRCSSACLGEDYPINLRETSRWWVTEKGNKFSKNTGWAIGVKWPLWMLDISTITPIKPLA